jgi:protein BUR2
MNRERPRPPPPAVAAEEQQWIFTEEDLLQTPSILDGMSPEEERTLRRKGVNFILQVGMMLKLPQTTLSTAAVFFNRYLVRNSLKASKGYKPLHHYVKPPISSSLFSRLFREVNCPTPSPQSSNRIGFSTDIPEIQQIAATALFLATKVEENCRKMKELVISCVRVALKDPNKLVDEQTKDFWKWRDTILYSEDVVLESLCFDLSIEPPYRSMYEMLKYYGLEHNKTLRNAAWAFLSDSCLTQLCLLFTSRTIAAASLYAGARMVEVELPDEDGRPWWEVQYVKIRDIRKACNLMADIYEQSPSKDGEASIYTGLKSPEDIEMSFDTPRSLDHGQTQQNGNGSNSNNGNGNGIGAAGQNQPEDGSEEGELDG